MNRRVGRRECGLAAAPPGHDFSHDGAGSRLVPLPQPFRPVRWHRCQRRVSRVGDPAALACILPAGLALLREVPTTPTRGENWALTQFWCSLTSGRSANQPSLKQIDLGPPIHLPFDQLEFRDLPFGLAVGPR
jgi:hypothetical protein